MNFRIFGRTILKMSFLSPEPTAAERSNGTGKFPLKVVRQCRVSSSISVIERDLSTGEGAILTFQLEKKERLKKYFQGEEVPG